jgi:hypothetical protein
MIWLFYLCLVGILVLISWYSWRYGITPTPTSAKVKNTLLYLLPLDVKGEIAELGSGWGTLAFSLAKHYPHNQVYALEISPIPYWTSQLLAQFLPYRNLHIIRQDFFEISLNHVALVVCYLYPDAMSRLKTKFEKELAPDAYVLSHTFAVPGWTPIQLVKAPDLYQTPVYLYQVQQSMPK